MSSRGFGALFALFLAACSSGSDDTPGGGDATGGSSTGGVAAATGGTQGTTGGVAATGGSTGGSTVGGVPATGGSPSTGGALATGGSPAAGGGAGGAAAGGNGGAAGSPGGGAPQGGAADGGVAGAAGGSGGASGSGGAAGGGAAGGGGAGAPSFSPCPPDPATPCAILPLGDSITEGFGSSGGGYRVELFRRAIAGKQNITFVGSQQNGPNEVDGRPFPRRHEGRGGYTIDSGGGHSGISGQITQQALAQNPHIVLLMIGTNDVNGNVDVGNAPMRLGRLIDDITTRAPDALVVVATIIPMVNGNNSKGQAYNQALPGLVSSRAAAGKHVVLLDNYALFAANPNYSSAWMGDSLHPNNAGYAELGKAFYGAIQSVLPVAP